MTLAKQRPDNHTHTWSDTLEHQLDTQSAHEANRLARTDENLKRGESTANNTRLGGAPTKLTPKVHRAIVSSVRNGNYIGTAAKAAGVARRTITTWKQKADSGIQPYAALFDELEAVSALAEEDVVRSLHANPDWRAKAWWLEHGPQREAWRTDSAGQATELAVALLDTLRTRSQQGELPASHTGNDVVVTAHTAEEEQPTD